MITVDERLLALWFCKIEPSNRNDTNLSRASYLGKRLLLVWAIFNMHASPDLTPVLQFDNQLQTVIADRRAIVQSHLEQWQTRFRAHSLPKGLDLDAFLGLERLITQSDAERADVRQNGYERWSREFLLPLAAQLQLLESTETATLQRLYRTGAFDQSLAGARSYRRPAPEILTDVRRLLTTIPFQKQRQTALLQQGFCRDDYAAKRVIEQWRCCERSAKGLVRHIVLAYLTYGDIGLLAHSTYPFADELLYVESQRALLTDMLIDSVDLARVQVDMIALARSWQAVMPQQWSIRVLREPRNSEYRRQLHETIGAQRQRAIAQFLSAQFHYAAVEAQTMVSGLLEGGLRALCVIQAHRQQQEVALDKVEQQHMLRVFRQHNTSLVDEDQDRIEELLLNLHRAIRMSNVPFPLVALLTERPSSQRRVQVSRRFALGLASIMQRRQQRRFRSLTTKRSEPQTRSAKVPGSSERSLTSSFAELSFLHETDAKNRLRDFITYGAIGLLSRAERHRAIHPQLSSWLRLIKYGRLDGRIPWPEVMAQLDIYRRELGLQRPVSPSLARAVFNSIRRPAFWHGGQGEATIRLRQRGALTLQSAAQLHANWIIASVELASPLTDNLGASIGHKGYLVVVIEEAGGFPLAIWPCATRPTLREVCLAVYQAIWHPGAENWPVKGIPEHLLIAADLVQGNTADLERAAAYLLSAIEVQPHTRLVKGKTKQLLLRVATQANKLLAQLEIGERGASRVLREMETWIISEFFSYHSAAPVWQEIARHGVVMPGHDTPAAGWLLPTNSDLLEVVDDRVTWQGRHYLARSALGKTVRCREYPLPVAVPHAADGLFGERLSTGASSTLVYLDADRRR